MRDVVDLHRLRRRARGLAAVLWLLALSATAAVILVLTTSRAVSHAAGRARVTVRVLAGEAADGTRVDLQPAGTARARCGSAAAAEQPSS